MAAQEKNNLASITPKDLALGVTTPDPNNPPPTAEELLICHLAKLPAPLRKSVIHSYFDQDN